MRAFTWRYCNLLQNDRAESKHSQFRCLQMAATLNWLSQQCPLHDHKINVSFVISINLFTNYENLVKISLVFAMIFGGICQFLPSFLLNCCKNLINSFLKLQSYSVDVHHIFTRFRGFSAAVNLCIHLEILQFVVERQSKA